jgi:hypothetical protein
MIKSIPDVSTLTAVQIVALATAIKEKQAGVNKGLLAEGFSENVNFKVRITGNVQKGQSTPGGTYEAPQTVSLSGLTAVCRALRFLGIGPVRLRKALESINPDDLQVDEELTNVFDSVAQAKSASLPTIKGTSAGQPAKVQTTIKAELIP